MGASGMTYLVHYTNHNGPQFSITNTRQDAELIAQSLKALKHITNIRIEERK
jgi:hypothetical protein